MREGSSYTLRGLIWLMVALPLGCGLLFLGVLMLGGPVVGAGGNPKVGLLAVATFFSVLYCMWRGLRFAQAARVVLDGEGVWVRYRPVFLAAFYTAGVGVIAALLPLPKGGNVFGTFNAVAGFAHLFSSWVMAGYFLFSSIPPGLIIGAPLGIYVFFALGMVGGYRGFQTTGRDWGVFAVAGLAVLGGMGFVSWRIVEAREQVLADDGSYEVFADRPEIALYHPFAKENRLVEMADPGLQIASDYPKWDGSTALYPVYAAAVQALYTGIGEKEGRDFVACSKTPNAYKRLREGSVDIILATPPSREQLAEAEAAGVTFKITPVGREAFVFFVNEENPVRGLSTEQLRGIYRKEITNWKAVGGASATILPFQRPDGSGSQTAFLRHVMKGERPAAPLEQERIAGMGGIIREAATYRNSAKALGYSFRYYLTIMDGTPEVRMLAIDGVEPTRESIASGRYPYTSELCLVTTAANKNPNVPRLVEWFLSPKGQALIEAVGYVGLAKEATAAAVP